MYRVYTVYHYFFNGWLFSNIWQEKKFCRDRFQPSKSESPYYIAVSSEEDKDFPVLLKGISIPSLPIKMLV